MIPSENLLEVQPKWMFEPHRGYSPTNGIFCKELPPDFYDVQMHFDRIVFSPRQLSDEEVLRFPDSPTEIVIDEINQFLESREEYEAYGLTYKRGIVMYGPQGNGKSCVVKLVAKDVISRGGYVLDFNHPQLFVMSISELRKRYPEALILCVMEDLDSIIQNCGEDDILNILDGVDKVDNVVFLATTNYPQKLGARIINRPSRFDRVIKVGLPSLESRKIYLTDLVNRGKTKGKFSDKVIQTWAENTNGFTLAHLKEMFISLVIKGRTMTDAITVINDMRREIKPEEYMDEVEFRKYQRKEAIRKAKLRASGISEELIDSDVDSTEEEYEDEEELLEASV